MTKYPLILNEVFHFVCLNLNEEFSPLLTSGSVLALLKHCLWGMLLSEQLGPECSEAVGKHPTCIPRPVFLFCFPRPRGRVRGRCPCVCHGSAVTGCSSNILDTLWCVGWRFCFFQCKASNLYGDEISSYLQHLKLSNISLHLGVLNSSLSYRLLIAVLTYSIFKWGFSCKDYLSVVSGNKQGAGRRLFFPIIFWHQCEKLTALTELGICTSQSSGHPCLLVKQY